MGKRTSFAGFLIVTVLISLLALACSKKQDDNIPPPPPDSTTAPEPNSPAQPAAENTASESEKPAAQEPPLAGRITAQSEAGSSELQLAKAEPASPAPPGLILAIAYSDKPSVLIGKELLSEGDTTQGVKVIKISESTVEFEKNGSRWTQQAGDPPSAYWADPNS